MNTIYGKPIEILSKKLDLVTSKPGTKIDIIDNSVPNMEFNVKNIKEELTIELKEDILKEIREKSKSTKSKK